MGALAASTMYLKQLPSWSTCNFVGQVLGFGTWKGKTAPPAGTKVAAVPKKTSRLSTHRLR